jgi:tight adherence protein B
MTTLSHALRAGYGLTQGIQAVSTDLPPPISTEFARTLRELGLGLTVEEALEGLVRRTKNQDLGIAVTGILINREVGGNLAELLDRVALTIRERVKLQNHIRILTIQGKISGVFAGLFPIFMAILFYILNPQYESVLFTTRMGQIAILVALTMQTIGALLVWRVVNIEA